MYPGVELRGVGHPARAVKTEIPRFARDDNRRRVGVVRESAVGGVAGGTPALRGRRVCFARRAEERRLP